MTTKFHFWRRQTQTNFHEISREISLIWKKTEISAWNSTRKSRVENMRLLSVIQTAEFSKRVIILMNLKITPSRLDTWRN